MPAPACAIAVDQAAPAMPRSKPNTRTTSITRFATFDATQDHQRGPIVRGATLDTLRRQCDQHERHADSSDTQVLHGELEHLAVGAECSRHRARAEHEERNRHDRYEARQPHRLHPHVGGVAVAACAETLRHPLGGAVGEEVRRRRRPVPAR